MDQAYFAASRFYRDTGPQFLLLPATWNFSDEQWAVAEGGFQRLWDSLPKIASDYPKYTTDHSFARGRESFRILRIRMGSPILLTVEGLSWVLVAAVIFSGGKIKIARVLQCQLPPLGVGIKALREALNPNRKNIPRPRRMRDSIKRSDEP
jgi:hypothetical protein